MAETPDHPQPGPSAQTIGPRPFATTRLVQIGSACTAVGVAILSKDWSRLWGHAFSNFPDSGSRAWRDITPMTDPVLLVHNHSEGIAPVTVNMLWDRASGKAYVLYLY
jgi:hypothetical protein